MYGSVRWRYLLTTSSRIEEVQGEKACNHYSSSSIVQHHCINKAICVAFYLGVDYQAYGRIQYGWLLDVQKTHSTTGKLF
jgi:hypothetical protein